MANLGKSVLGHRIEVVIKGERGQSVTGVPIHVGLGGIVLDVVDDDRQPWHIAAADVARGRLDCTCILTQLPPDGWSCPELAGPEQRLLLRVADEVAA